MSGGGTSGRSVLHQRAGTETGSVQGHEWHFRARLVAGTSGQRLRYPSREPLDMTEDELSESFNPPAPAAITWATA